MHKRDKKGRFIKGTCGFTGKHSEEVKRRLSFISRNKIATKAQLESLAMGRLKHTQLCRQKKFWNEERKNKFSKAQIGKKLSEKTKLKISKANKGKGYSVKGGINGAKKRWFNHIKIEVKSKFKKEKLSKELLSQQRRIEQKKYWENNDKARERSRLGGIKGLQILAKMKETKPEKNMRLKLDELKIYHIPKHVMYNKFEVDEWIPSKNTIIEVDGRYWHNLQNQKNRDRARDAYLSKCGHRIIRVWEDEVSNFSMDAFK